MKSGKICMKRWKTFDWHEESENWYEDLEDCRLI